MNAKHFDTKEFCDSLYHDASNFLTRINNCSAAINQLDGKAKKELQPYIRHLKDISDFLEWKLEIFSKVCLIDMSEHVGNVENVVSVPVLDVPINESKITSPGYLGG